MAGGAKADLIVMLVVMVVAIMSGLTDSAITCELVVSSLTPCETYLTKGDIVPSVCCDGVKSLYKDAETTADRQKACRCLEQAATLVPGINVEYASSLPGKCGVNFPYPINPTFNCSMYSSNPTTMVNYITYIN
ncbi:hypothetical protein R6Q57_002286 [Mikania cordata]